MLKLIRLEWKKNNVGKYIRNVVIMSALICMFIFALCYLGIANDPDTGVPDAAPGNSAISSSIELFTSMAFRSEEHTSELQSRFDLVCRLLLEKKNNNMI